MTPEEQTLPIIMRRVFTDRPFDYPCILGEADFCPELWGAIKAAVPNCYRKARRKYPLAHELFRGRVLRPFFEGWAKQHCTFDRAGWWYLKDPLSHGPRPSDGPPPRRYEGRAVASLW